MLTINGTPFDHGLERASRIGILGTDDFIDKVRRQYLRDRMENPDQELCELRRLRTRPKLSEIAAQIDKELGASNRLIKRCTIFLAHKHAGFKLREIGEFFELGPGAVSASYRKTAKEIESNETLHRVIDAIQSRLVNADLGSNRSED